jgi:SNF2 family DNA or RNA helicase
VELERFAPLLSAGALPEAQLPSDLTAELRGYQRRGVDWLCFLRDAGFGALLADDMGLGKTLQTICALSGKSLVVCPTSVIHNWLAEIARFRPGLTAARYHGAGRKLDDNAAVIVTSYAVMRNDIELLAQQRWACVVLDESQTIKNPDSQVARAVYRLEAAFRVTLSGTPVENRLEELWSQMHFVNPGLLGGRDDFRARFADPIESGTPGAAARLRTRIRPFLLRRLKSEVASELPPRTDIVLYCELEPDEREVYSTVLAATRSDVMRELDRGGNVLAALEALLRLRQAACDRALLPGQAPELPASSKVRRLLAALEELCLAGHRALVFSQWTSLMDRIEPELRAASIAFERLDGATRDRAGVVRRFQDRDGPPVLLASLKAGGTGLNLTAADHVFLLDPWWNPAAEDQAADRAHRIGQDRPVMVHRLVTKDTVEERVLELQAHKRGLADAALGEADRATRLTRQDVLALLG